MIKAVVFDAIDTLFMAYPDKIGMYMRITKEQAGLDVTREQMSEVWAKVFSETENKAKCENDESSLAWENFNENILKELGYEGDCKEVGKKLHYESWFNPNNFRLYDDVLTALNVLKESGYVIGCLSNEDEGLYKFFDHFNIRDFFEFILISGELGCEKPHRKAFDEVVKRVKLERDEILYVGDSVISDYYGAIGADLKAVLIDRDSCCQDEKVIKIKSLEELSKLIRGESFYGSTVA